MNEIRVRFAPSPTGFMHVGNARTALFNWLFACKHNGKFILRIEDTDSNRSTDQARDMIIRDLTWLQINWDEGFDKGGEYGPYCQSDRCSIYQAHLEKLKESQAIYPCYCTREDLDKMREKCFSEGKIFLYDRTCLHLKEAKKKEFELENRPFVWRFKVPDKPIVFEDIIRGPITFESQYIGDFVLTKSTGEYTFHFAVSVDDATMKISHVIRGEDHLSNTVRHVILLDALNYIRPFYAHIPMIMGKDGAKLSKRNGLISINDYRKMGFLPESMNNYMSFLGWAPNKGEGSEIYTLDELAQCFNLKDILKSSSTFDLEKLKWFNSYYLRHLDLDRLTTISLPYLKKEELIHDVTSEKDFSEVKTIVDAVKGNLSCLDDLARLTSIYFLDFVDHSDSKVQKILGSRSSKDLLLDVKQQMESLEEWTISSLKSVFKNIQKRSGVKGKNLYLPIRMALSGQEDGIDILTMIKMIGRKKSLERINKSILI